MEKLGSKSFKTDFMNTQNVGVCWVIKLTVSQTELLIKQRLKGKNSQQRYEIREKWHSFGLKEKVERLETPSTKLTIYHIDRRRYGLMWKRGLIYFLYLDKSGTISSKLGTSQVSRYDKFYSHCTSLVIFLLQVASTPKLTKDWVIPKGKGQN